MKINLVAILVFLTIIGQHLAITTLGGFPLTVGFLCGGVTILILVRRVPYVQVSITWSAIILLSGTAALVSDNVAGEEYFRTLLLFLLVSAILIASATHSDLSIFAAKPVKNSIFLALVIVVALSLTQTLTGMLGSEEFFNVFGQYQYLYQYNPHLEFNAFPRAQGFFLEPSYNSFVIGTLGIVLLCLRKNIIITILLVAMGLLVSQSATGLTIFALILIVAGIRSSPSKLIVIITIGGLATAAVGSYLEKRFASILVESSSANYRIVAPLEVLGDILAEKPLGQPFGSIDTVLQGYDLSNGGTLGTSIDNGFYVVVYYFGWVGIIALLLLLTATIALSLKGPKKRESYAWIAPLWLCGSLAFSGGIMLPEFGIMTSFVIMSYMHSIEARTRIEYVSVKRADTFDHRNNL